MRRKIAKHRRQVTKAIDLYVRFRGEDPKLVERVSAPNDAVALVVGECDGVLYTTRRDGKQERYIHEFRKNSRPLLCTSADGKQLYLLGGQYDFTDAGIVDR